MAERQNICGNPNGTMSVEYIWIGGQGELRSKIRTLNGCLKNIENHTKYSFPEWNYDGSSTGQATGDDSEVCIRPRVSYISPFFNSDEKNQYFLVMCDTYRPNGKPLKNNYRFNANKIFSTSKAVEEKPWYGIEQEYFLINNETGYPLGFDIDGDAEEQGRYYCSVGHGNAWGREVAEKHYQYCLRAGIKISGMNAEVAPGQWEFQVGPCEGIEAGDSLYVARYILLKLAEQVGYYVCFEPKPVKGDWNGSGCHTNFSTKSMREGTNNKKGIEYINQAIEKLALKHDEHMRNYGTGNEERMTGEHETSRYDRFSFGIANRGASVRVPNKTLDDEKGYFEDRRPSSNMDPYLVSSLLFRTCILD